MNWLQTIAQLNSTKPMALPKYPPSGEWEDRGSETGVGRIDNVMTDQTAEEVLEPGMEYLGHGSFGIVYQTGPGEVAKFTKDPREAETAKLVFDQQYDWVVPMLYPPEQVQYDPPVYRLRMKELKPLRQPEEILVKFLSNRLEKLEEVTFEEVIESFVPYLDADTVMYLYKRMHYIFQQNEDTLWLTDLHEGNFGWDDGELKVWDLGPGTSK